MSENIVLYCDDCGSERVVVHPIDPPRRVSITEYSESEGNRSDRMNLVLRSQLWIVRCTECGKSRTFLR